MLFARDDAARSSVARDVRAFKAAASIGSRLLLRALLSRIN